MGGTESDPLTGEKSRRERSVKMWRWIALLIFVAVAVLALRLIGPAVPNEIRMLTGPEGTTFYEDGLRYQEIFRRHGVDVHVGRTQLDSGRPRETHERGFARRVGCHPKTGVIGLNR